MLMASLTAKGVDGAVSAEVLMMGEERRVTFRLCLGEEGDYHNSHACRIQKM